MQNRKFIVIAISVLFVTVSFFLGYRTWVTLRDKQMANEAIQVLPSLRFRYLDGGLFRLDSMIAFKQRLVLNYFNTECEHCQSMAKEMLYSKKKLSNVHWLMVSAEKPDVIKSFADTMQLHLLPSVTLLSDTSLALQKTFNPGSIPSFYVYQRGNLILKHHGECSIEYLLQ